MILNGFNRLQSAFEFNLRVARQMVKYIRQIYTLYSLKLCGKESGPLDTLGRA